MPATVNTKYTNQGGLVTTLWPQKSVNLVVARASPAIGIIPKDENADEFYWKKAVGTASNQGFGSSYAGARAARQPSKFKQFDLQPYPYYGSDVIDGRTMRRGRKKPAVVVDLVKQVSKGMLSTMQRAISCYLHGNGGGAIAKIQTVVGSVITLTPESKIGGLDEGFTIATSVTDGTSGSVKAGSGIIGQIGGVEGAYTLTADGGVNWSTLIATIANGDYIFRADTFGNVFHGFAGWNPQHSGAPGTFLGVNRDTNANKLAGWAVNCATLSTRQAIVTVARRCYDAGGEPDVALISTKRWESLANEAGTSGGVRMTKMPAAPINKISLGIDYQAVEIIGPCGPIMILPDQHMPDDIVRVLTKDTWQFRSSGPLIQWIDNAKEGQLKMENDDDAYEFRLIGDFELECEAPGYNGMGYGLT